MKTEGRAFLFDYPGDAHLPDGGEAMVQEAVAGTDLAVFISHSHEDHLNNDLVTMASTADSVRYVLSDDVEDMRPETIPSGAEVLIVEPDERYEFGGMTVETLLSNDLGVAFMVEDGDFRFYFGGDLAKWVWPSASEKSRRLPSGLSAGHGAGAGFQAACGVFQRGQAAGQSGGWGRGVPFCRGRSLCAHAHLWPD